MSDPVRRERPRAQDSNRRRVPPPLFHHLHACTAVQTAQTHAEAVEWLQTRPVPRPARTAIAAWK